MGFWSSVGHVATGALDRVGGQAEDLLQDGERLAGTGVDNLSHVAAATLDGVGLQSSGTWLRRHGDQLADHLGATVAERGLGETDDPTLLVHGDTGRINAAVTDLGRLAVAFSEVAGGLSGIDAGLWTGQGGEAFHAAWSTTPQDWQDAGQACSAAASALETYVGTLTWAQQQAAEAIRQWEVAQAARADAVSVDSTAAADPAPAMEQAAQQVLSLAREQRNTAASIAATALTEAASAAPALPRSRDRMGGDLSDLWRMGTYEAVHFTGGALEGAGDLLRTARSLNPSDPYNLAHPAEFVQGMSDTAAGLAYAAHHPMSLVHGFLGTGWGSDPFAAAGRLLPGVLLAVATDGTSAVRGAADVTTLGERGALSFGERCPVVCGDPVDVATGAVWLDQVDVELPGLLPLVVRRRHSSDWRYGSWFGRTWSSTFDERVEVAADHVVAVLADTRALVFPRSTEDCPVRPVTGGGWTLTPTRLGGYRLTDPETAQTRHYLAADDAGVARLAALTDPLGHRVTILRDSWGCPVEVRHTGGYRVSVETFAGRVQSLRVLPEDGPEDGREPVEVARYHYCDDGHLVGVTNASGKELCFSYDGAGRLAAWTDRNGTSYGYEYDDEGRCVAQAGTGGVMANRFRYVDLGGGLRETVATDSRGHATRFLVDDRLDVVARIDPLGNQTRSEWDADHRLCSRTDALGHTTRFSYDDAGRLTRIVRPDASEQLIEYAPGTRALPTRVTLPDGTVWRQEYDARGLRTALTDPAGATTRFAYDQRGHLAAVVDALGGVRRIETDGTGLPTVVVEPGGATTRLERDAFGRVTALVDPVGARTEMTWSPAGRLASRTLADGSTQTWTYDGEGNPVEEIDAAGRTTRATYTHFDLPATLVTPDGALTSFEYDSDLRLTRVTNAGGRAWRYEYDPAGRLAAETDFNGRSLRYEYDAAGRLVRRVNGAGEAVTFELDALGNVVGQRAGETETRLAYDPMGRLTRATGPEVELVLQRDPVGRIVAESLNGRTMFSTYDALGRRVRRRTPAGVVTDWTHGPAGPERVTVAGHTLAFQRDHAGREVRRTLAGVAALDQSWDPLGRLAGQRITSPVVSAAMSSRLGGIAAPEPAVLQERSYAYSPTGAMVSVRDRLGGVRRFELDLADRITSVTGGTVAEVYGYDPMGNLTEFGSDSAEYDGTLLRRAGPSTYSYDGQGRLVRKVTRRPSRKAAVWTYAWDAEDRLTSVTTPDRTVWTYTYDVLGRRVAKHRLATDGSVAERTLFSWDGLTLAEEHAVAGSRTWVHDGVAPLAQVDRMESSDDEVGIRFHAIVTDLIGTPTELLTADGALAWAARRTLWGAPTGAEADPVPLRFPGQYADPETGLHYNHHRYYDPDTGRYLTQDPLGLAPAPNPTAYVPNPTAASDPLGLAPCVPGTTNGTKFELKRLGGSRYESPAGLIYGPGSKHGHRLTHVLQHTVPDPTKVAHSVFSSSALPTIDEAWMMRGAPTPGDPGAYVIPMGRTVGTAGEDGVRIIVKPGTTEVISAYPWVAP